MTIRQHLCTATLAALALGGCFKNDGGESTEDTTAATTGAPQTGTTAPDGSTTDEPPATTGEPTTGAPDTTGEPTTGAVSSTGDDTGVASDCAGYCDLIEQNCGGEFTQYGSKDTCLTTCAAFAPGAAGDMAGNNLACRIYHAGAAAMADDVHCTHAGPGGDTACGSNCEGFCAIAGKYCPEAWADNDACIVACTGFDATEKYDASDVGGNTLACRLYHATAASFDAATHCPHIVGASPPCM
jgi:hypothetical protein